VQLRQVPNQVGRLHVGWQMMVLRRVADARPNLRAGFLRIGTEHLERPAITGLIAKHERQEGRLASTVRTEQTGDARPHIDGYVTKDDGRAEALDDPLGRYHFAIHSLTSLP